MAKQIPLTRGRYALVDDADYDRLMQYKWFFSCDGYARRHVWVNGKNRTEHMHRLVVGDSCVGFDVDHINGDRLDNRRCNLRVATRSQNMANARPHADGGTGYKGVSFDRNKNKYIARICRNYKQQHLGYYATAEEAANAYNEAARELFGQYARTNKIKGDKHGK